MQCAFPRLEYHTLTRADGYIFLPLLCPSPLIVMASPPASLNPKHGVRSYLREKYHKLVRSHSRSPSQQSEHVETSNPSGSTIGNFLVPPPASQAVSLRHVRSDDHISSSKHAAQSRPRSRATAWVGLRTALEELCKAARVFPPLESAISSLISVLDLLEVCFLRVV